MTYSHVVIVGVDGGGAWFDDADTDPGKVDCFCGMIDDFLLFNDVLSDEEIALLAAYYGK